MTFKPLNENDTVNTRTLLHEAIPLTGAIVSGTYGTDNIKTYSHGMFQSVYDYPYLSSSANHIFDITAGIHPDSSLYSSITVAGQQSKKRNIYNQMAQVLMGYDATGSIQKFDEDGNLLVGDKIEECFIMPFSRLLVKDEIKKESFSMTLGVDSGHGSPFSDLITITDHLASTSYKVNSPAGDYGILYATASSAILNASSTHTASFDGSSDKYWYAGLIFYQAGIVVLTGSVFGTQLDTANQPVMISAGDEIDALLTGSTIDVIGDALRNRIQNIEFNNTTELNSTVYFCRINHNEFNYSSNPTYLSNSRIQIKTQASDEPLAYITTIGLYNDNNELLATAKLSEPLKKSASNEFTIRARLDY